MGDVPLSIDDIKRFLAPRGALDHCAACRKIDWAIFNEGDDVPALMISKPGGIFDMSAPRHIPLVLLICKNCGFVRPHAVAVIEAENG